MRRGIIGVGFMLIAALVAAADESRNVGEVRQIEKAVQAVIAKSEPAVACVMVYRETESSSQPVRPLFPPDDPERMPVPDYYGSGVVLTSNGHILTNYHVVRGAKNIQVRLPAAPAENGVESAPRVAAARILAADNRSDLAVLELRSSIPPAPTLTIGRGEDLKKGSFVVSLAHPYAAGYRDGSASASWGIVSNLRRHSAESSSEAGRASKALSQLGTLLQTDVKIQLGASGGALVDLDGKLVGLTTSQAALNGVDSPGGFAMPMDASARRIIEVLLRGEEVEYGFLGVGAAFRFPSAGGGVRLGRIVPNSPADHAGLQLDDVILKVNDQAVHDQDDLFLQLGTSLAGHRATLLIRRDNKERTKDVTLAKTSITIPDRLEGVARQGDGRPRIIRLDSKEGGIATNRKAAIYGLRVDYASVIAGDGPIADGVVVREVKPNSPAHKANLQEYADIITHVNGKRVSTPSDFYDLAQRLVAADERITLIVGGTFHDAPRTVTLP